MPRTTNKNDKKASSRKAAAATTASSRKSAKGETPVKATYRGAKYGNVKYRSASALVRYLLRNTKLPQVQIARKCNVTEACVSQLARVCR